MAVRLAYLFPAFPVFHQTFVLWEVLGLRRHGISPRLYSLRRGTEKQQPEAAEVASEVNYLPGLASGPVLRANLRLLGRAPLAYLGLYAAVVAAWKTGAVRPEAEAPSRQGRVTAYNRIRGWYNSNPLPYLAKSLALVPLAVFLAERLKAEGITHLHVHWATYPATVAYVVNRLTGIPFSISAHAYDIYMVQRMLPAKLAAASFLVTCARTNAAFLERVVGPALSRRIRVSYHGVNVSRFAPSADDRPFSGPLRIVSCGQLERYKGMHVLLEACALLNREGYAFECSIVGEGPEKGALLRQAASLGIGDRVHLLGARPHDEVARLLRESHVFALASELVGRQRRRDVIANVIVEAMAAGLPVVASNIPGVEELIDDGQTGFLAAPNDPESVAAGLRRFAESPEVRAAYGAAARERVLRDFDNRKNILELAGWFQSSGATSSSTSGSTSR